MSPLAYASLSLRPDRGIDALPLALGSMSNGAPIGRAWPPPTAHLRRPETIEGERAMRLPAAPVTPTVVFDLDGTLVHTVPDIADALDIALAPYGTAPTSIGEAASMMGDGLSEFFLKALVEKASLSMRGL
jgi:hypothetical protein